MVVRKKEKGKTLKKVQKQRVRCTANLKRLGFDSNFTLLGKAFHNCTALTKNILDVTEYLKCGTIRLQVRDDCAKVSFTKRYSGVREKIILCINIVNDGQRTLINCIQE